MSPLRWIPFMQCPFSDVNWTRRQFYLAAGDLVQTADEHQQNGLLDVVIAIDVRGNALGEFDVDIGVLCHGLNLSQLLICAFLLHVLQRQILLTNVVRSHQICLELETPIHRISHSTTSVMSVHRLKMLEMTFCM